MKHNCEFRKYELCLLDGLPCCYESKERCIVYEKNKNLITLRKHDNEFIDNNDIGLVRLLEVKE